MNFMKKVFHSCLLGLGCSLLAMLSASGQTTDNLADIPPPTAPFVAPVPDKAQWAITLDYSGLNPASPAPNAPLTPNAAPAFSPGANPLTEIQSVKTGTLKQDILVYKSHPSMEFWYTGNTVLQVESTGNVVVFDLGMLVPDSGDPHGPLVKAIAERGNLAQSVGFPGLDWVKLKYYDKVVFLDKIPCYHYVFPAEGSTFAEAWINVATKMPIKYAASGVLYTFAFGPPPTTDLVLPSAAAKASSASNKFLDHSRQLESAVGH